MSADVQLSDLLACRIVQMGGVACVMDTVGIEAGGA